MSKSKYVMKPGPRQIEVVLTAEEDAVYTNIDAPRAEFDRVMRGIRSRAQQIANEKQVIVNMRTIAVQDATLGALAVTACTVYPQSDLDVQFSDMSRTQCAEWYLENVGYNPTIDDPNITTEQLRMNCEEICRASGHPDFDPTTTKGVSNVD